MADLSKQENDVTVKSKSNSNEFTDIKFSGNVIGGLENFDDFYDSDENGATKVFLRRAKIGFDLSFNKHWKGALELVLKEKDKDLETDLGDAYLSYKGLSLGKQKLGTMKIGHMREPLGFERLTGLSKIHTGERSLTSSSFAPGRNYGIQISKGDKHWTWSIGYFQSDEFDNDAYSITARASFAPIFNQDSVLHLGFSFSQRDLDNSSFQIKERAGLFSTDNTIRSAEFIAEKDTLAGLELYWQYNSLSFTSEYIVDSVQQISGPKWDYSGYYFQSSYFLTDDKTRYKKGKLRSVKPSAPSGAWELVARYNETDLRDNDLGALAKIIEAGVNYYYQESVIIKLNAQHTSIVGNSINTQAEGNAASIRLVFKY